MKVHYLVAVNPQNHASITACHVPFASDASTLAKDVTCKRCLKHLKGYKK